MLEQREYDVESFFSNLQQLAEQIVKEEPVLTELFNRLILKADCFSHCLAGLISGKLCNSEVTRDSLYYLCLQAYEDAPQLMDAAIADVLAVVARDPASSSPLRTLLFLKGPNVMESWRVSHWLWEQDRRDLASYLQSRISEVFSVDIHPAAKIGRGIMLDHATNIVIGETAVVSDMVSILHDVTLGGTGKECGDRHPKVGRGVMIGAGAKILGNIKIGTGAIVGAGSVVLRDVPPHTTVVGVPARVVGNPRNEMPSLDMDQTLSGCTTDIAVDPCPLISAKVL